MFMKKAFLIPVLLVLTLGAFAQDGSMMKSTKPAADASGMKAVDSSAYAVDGLGPQVKPFTTEKDAWALAKTQTVVYFFAATWCPDCQATYRDIQAHFAQIPSSVTVLFVNYDKSADLKKKYAVTSQHTFVVVGPAGEKKQVWNGSTTVADLVKTAMMK
jgi:thiol-disulfide isomerase/thioredoxin